MSSHPGYFQDKTVEFNASQRITDGLLHKKIIETPKKI